jgi:hypothetical protein
MLEMKDFYGLICKRNIIQKLIDFSFSESNNQTSQNAALAVLNALVS